MQQEHQWPAIRSLLSDGFYYHLLHDADKCATDDQDEYVYVEEWWDATMAMMMGAEMNR